MAKRPPPPTREQSANGSSVANVGDTTIPTAARAVEATEDENSDFARLSSGVVLRLHKAPPYAIQTATQQAGDQPEPPLVYIETNGRNEPNPDDPDYKRALARWRLRQSELLSNVLFLLGTSIEHVPEGVPRVEDDGWIDKLRVIGIPIDSQNEHERYLAWLRYVALESPKDISYLIQSVIRGSGATEEDVQQALDSFRSDEEWGEDQSVSGEELDQDGDQL